MVKKIVLSPIGYILSIPFISDRIKVLLVRWYIYFISMLSSQVKREEEKEVRLSFQRGLITDHLTETDNDAVDFVEDFYCMNKILRIRFKNGKPYGIYLKYALRKKDKPPMKVCLRIAYYVGEKVSGQHEFIFSKLLDILKKYKISSQKFGVCLYNESKTNLKIWGNIPLVKHDTDANDQNLIRLAVADYNEIVQGDNAFIEFDVQSPEDYLTIFQQVHDLKTKKLLQGILSSQVEKITTIATSV